jgi:hypothetical protein
MSKERSFCTHRTRLWPARTATRSLSSAPASSSSTQTDSSANPAAARPAEPLVRLSAATSVVVLRTAVVAPAAPVATLQAPARCSLPRARAAAARPRFRSARAARSPSTAAIASPRAGHNVRPRGQTGNKRSPANSAGLLAVFGPRDFVGPGNSGSRGSGFRHSWSGGLAEPALQARITLARAAAAATGSAHSALAMTTIVACAAGRYHIADQKPSR